MTCPVLLTPKKSCFENYAAPAQNFVASTGTMGTVPPHPRGLHLRARSMSAMATMDMDESLKNSTLYQDFLAERDEILKHKWIESEKAGYDIGFDWALTDWVVKHRTGWRRWYNSQRAGRP